MNINFGINFLISAYEAHIGVWSSAELDEYVILCWCWALLSTYKNAEVCLRMLDGFPLSIQSFPVMISISMILVKFSDKEVKHKLKKKRRLFLLKKENVSVLINIASCYLT